MNIHSMLWNDVSAFSFVEDDFVPLLPDTVTCHKDIAGFLSAAAGVELALTWDWDAAWYEHCPNLKTIMTPAAGADWVQPDPNGRVQIVHGTFHGPMLAESLLQALLFMNHGGPAMLRNFTAQAWDRNLQRTSRMLRQQKVLIIGLGQIGRHCERLIAGTGAEVAGIRRHNVHRLDSLLPTADHVVLLLPGNAETAGFMNAARLQLMKDGAFVYNFGRGNVLPVEDLLTELPRLGGAFLDVTEPEPLPDSSPLWHAPNVMITPHSSCVYTEYRALFVAEVADQLVQLA